MLPLAGASGRPMGVAQSVSASGAIRQAPPFLSAIPRKTSGLGRRVCHDGAVAEHSRYGVFLRPDPLTCAAVTQITAQLRAQYGLVSANAFPPHATLAGSLPIADPAELVTALSRLFAGVTPFPVANAGLVRMWGGLVYAIHDVFGAPNVALVNLAAAVQSTVRPLLSDVAPGEPEADLSTPGEWVAHLSLASHDLAERPDLLDEVDEY